MSNQTTLPIPGCELSLLSLSLTKEIPYFDVLTDFKLTSALINGEVAMNSVSTIYVKEYIAGIEYIKYKQSSNNIKTNLGLSLLLPRISFDFPGFTINRFPRINSGCNDKINPSWPIICGTPSLRQVRRCRKVLGVTVCAWVYVPEYDKRLGEMYIGELQISPLNLFTLEETVAKLQYKLIPNVEMSSTVSAGQSFGVTFGVVSPEIDTGTKVLEFTLSKLVVGLTINIESLQFTYGGHGLNLENISIPLLVNQDLLFGGSITATADDEGNIQAYYFIKQIKVSLLQLLVAPLAVAIGIVNDPTFQSTVDSVAGDAPSDAAGDAAGAVADSGFVQDLAATLPAIENTWNTYCAPVYNALKNTIGLDRAKMIFNKIINFFKDTPIDIAIGLLLCPRMMPTEPNILSCVFTSAFSFKPFAGLNKLDDVKVPDDYIPKFPSFNFDFFGGSLINSVTNEFNNAVAGVESSLADSVNETQQFITDELAGLSLDFESHVPVPIIPNPAYVPVPVPS